MYGHTVADGTDAKVNPAMNNVKSLQVVDFYNKLLPIEAGQQVKPEDSQMTAEMKEFLLYEFGTTKVSEVNKDQLKAKLDGPAFIERISYRKAVAMNVKKEAIAKG